MATTRYAPGYSAMPDSAFVPCPAAENEKGCLDVISGEQLKDSKGPIFNVRRQETPLFGSDGGLNFVSVS